MGITLPEPAPVNGGIRLTVVTDHGELRKYADDWNRLVTETGSRTEMSYVWISCHLETRLNSGESWFCLFAHDGGRLVGVLPVVTVPRKWFGMFKCFRFETPFDVFNTGAVEALLLKGYEESAFRCFIGYLWKIPCACCCLRFRDLPDGRLPHLMNCRGRQCNRPVVQAAGSESFIPVSGTLDEYVGTLSKKFYREYCRTGRRIQEQPEVQFRFETGHSAVNAEKFMDVEHQGWKAKSKTSILSDESYVKFFRLLTARLEEQGWLRWAFLDIGGETAAGQFMAQSGDVLYVVKIGYNEKFSKLSPGTVLFGRVIEEAFKPGGTVKELNYMSGFPWLRDWGVHLRQLATVDFFPSGVCRLGICRQPLRLRAFISRHERLRNLFAKVLHKVK